MIGRAATVDKEHTVRELRRRSGQSRLGNAIMSYREIYFVGAPWTNGETFTAKEARIAMALAADAIEAGDFPALEDW